MESPLATCSTELGPFGVHQINNVLDKVSWGVNRPRVCGPRDLPLDQSVRFSDRQSDGRRGLPPGSDPPPGSNASRMLGHTSGSSLLSHRLKAQFGTHWKSTLELFNPDDSTAIVTLTLLESGNPIPPPRENAYWTLKADRPSASMMSLRGCSVGRPQGRCLMEMRNRPSLDLKDSSPLIQQTPSLGGPLDRMSLRSRRLNS